MKLLNICTGKMDFAGHHEGLNMNFLLYAHSKIPVVQSPRVFRLSGGLKFNLSLSLKTA